MYKCPQLMMMNYMIWAIRNEVIVVDQGIKAAVQPVADETVDAKLCKKAKAHLLQALHEVILMQVEKRKTSKESL